MKKLTDTQISNLTKFLVDQITSASKTYDKDSGRPMVVVNIDPFTSDVSIIYTLTGTRPITPTEEKNLNKRLRREVLDKFNVDATIEHAVRNQDEHSDTQATELFEQKKIPASILRNALLTLVDPIENPISIPKIDAFIRNWSDPKAKVTQETFMQLFQELLWLSYRSCLESCPSLKCNFGFSLFLIGEFYGVVVDQLSEKILSLRKKINDIKVRHATVYNFFSDEGSLVTYLNSRSEKEFIKTLNQLKTDLEAVRHNSHIDDSAKETMLGLCFAAGSLYEKLKNLQIYLQSTKYAKEFQTMLGVFWVAQSNLNLKNIMDFNRYHFDRASGLYAGMAKLLEDLENYSKDAMSKIDAKIKSIKDQRIEALEAHKQKVKELQKAELQTRQQLLETQPPVVSSEPQLSTIVPPAPNVTLESKLSAKSIEDRHNSKRTAREQKRFGLFSASVEETKPKVTMFSLSLIDMQSGGTQDVVVCPDAPRKLNSPIFRILPDSYVLASYNPCFELSNALRRLLHANEGRGFVPEFSPGQTGLKYCKQGKESFVVLKGSAEERVFCAVLDLQINALQQRITLIVPVHVEINHDAYERLLNRPNLSAWLRKLSFDKILIEEGSSHLDLDIPTP